jgi:hypothetical protein
MNLVAPAGHSAIAVSAGTTHKTGPGQLVGVLLTGGGAAATLTLYDNTAASGTVLCVVKTGVNNSSQQWVPLAPYAFSKGLTSVLTGTGAVATAVYY